MARLLIKTAGLENRTFDLRLGINRVGRDPNCDFTIHHPSVSSIHCEIIVSADGVLLRDSNSTNGTLTGAGANRTFTPNTGWSGTTTLTFTANDGVTDSAAAAVTITVNAPTSIPVAPSGLTATVISKTQIDLAWNDDSSNEDGFKIERSTNGSTWTQIAVVGPNIRNYSSTGLAANKTYFYRVRAFNVLGNSAYSNTISAKTLH